MNVGSVCSGIGGLDLGLERAGMRVVFQCEKDEWCRGILAQHWPGVPCWDDLVHLRESAERGPADPICEAANGRRRQAGAGLPSRVDLICGGTPCQDLSVAGRRAGLGGERSSLFFEFARVADELVRPGGWLVFENVPGLFSSPGGARSGRDFAIILATLADIGFHDLAWRVLDSRYFGVPQRRRRVYIVGRRAVGECAKQVLLEPESGGGDFAPGREARTRVAASLSRGSSGAGVSAPGRRQEDDENIVAGPLTKRYGKGVNTTADDEAAVVAHTLRAEGFDASEDGTGRGTPLAVDVRLAGGRERRRTPDDEDMGDLQRVNGAPADADGVREAPVVPGRVDDPPPDGPRYAAMGNAVTVNVAHWIGLRIMAEVNRRQGVAA